MKKYLLHAITAGALAGIAGVVYLQIYQSLYLVDYSLVISAPAIVSSSFIGTILMSLGYFAADRLRKPTLRIVLNLVFILLSFLSILPVMLMSLPLEVEFPELFPGLAVPMHFFPALFFLGVSPVFYKLDVRNE
jgi:type III secretory pathway component EscS